MDAWKAVGVGDVRKWIAPVGGAAVGLGLLMARANIPPPIPPCFAAHPDIARAHPGLAQATNELAQLNHERTDEFVASVVQGAKLATSTDPGAQWMLARNIGKTMAIARHICSTSPMHESDEQYRQVLACTGDTLPQMETWLDALLTNHLLAR